MNIQGRGALAVAAALLVPIGCSEDDKASADTETADTQSDTDDLPEGHARVVHSFGVYDMAALEEWTGCLQWTLDNEQPIYVKTVELSNNGGYHHSNWYIVPDTYAPGEDGFFDCDARGFTELEAAVVGGAMWAQSTQSRRDGVEYPDGAVVKIPARHKLVANAHLLNLADAPHPTEGRMALEIVHPSEVQVVLSPFRLSYYDLDIPARAQSRHTGRCDMSSQYGGAAGTPFDIKLYYVMPHYHYLGDYFDLTVLGGARDGESVFRLDGFNADNNGQVFDPPLDMTGANGFQFTCGYDNWRDKNIGWGIGDQEMCVMLGMADSKVLMDASVLSGGIVGTEGDLTLYEGNCTVLAVGKSVNQAMPTPEEIAAPLYVPPTDPDDQGLPPVAPCVDTPAEATPRQEPTLRNIFNTLFISSCTYASCHQFATAQAGLDLMATDLHAELLGHQVLAKTAMPLVAPGDPEGSYLYHLLSTCDPQDADGNTVRHMPLNAPFLSDPDLVAMVRDWIAAGAPNN